MDMSIIWPASLTPRLLEAVPYWWKATIMHLMLIVPFGHWVLHLISKTTIVNCSELTHLLLLTTLMMKSVPQKLRVDRHKASTLQTFPSAKITIIQCYSRRAIYRIMLSMAPIASWRRTRRITRQQWGTSKTKVNPKMPLWYTNQLGTIHRWEGFKFLHTGQWGSLSKAVKMVRDHNQIMQIIRVT